MVQTNQQSQLQNLKTLSGTVDYVIYHNPTSLYVVCTVIYRNDKGENEQIKMTGYSSGIREGEEYEFTGAWFRHPKYGRQFNFAEADLVPPVGRGGIVRYLAGVVDGVGAVRAQKIVDALGENALDKIKKDPTALNSPELSFLTDKQRNDIVQNLLENAVVAELASLICQRGIGRGILNKIYNKFGPDSVKVIKENPYILTDEVWGIGFKKADLIAQNIGIAPNSPHRIKAAISFVLKEAAQDGHCYFTPAIILKKLIGEKGLLANSGVITEHVAKSVQKMIDEKKCLREGNAVYLTLIHEAECAVAGVVRKLLAKEKEMDKLSLSLINKKISAMEQKYNVKYERKQQEAIQTAVTSPISIITGGPGTGKTTVIQAICDVYSELHTGEPAYVYLAAPTGRASKRMNEATGRPASTIHRLLKYQPEDGGFEYTFGNPLPGPGLVIIDESSMMDIGLASHLFAALDRHQVVLVGDVDQLPSVGPGSVLRDLITCSRVPTVELEFNYRQAGGSKVAKFATLVRDGTVPPLVSDGDFNYIEAEDAEQAAGIVLDLVGRALKDGLGQMDFQVLAPMKKGEAGVKKLNERVRDLIREERKENNEKLPKLSGFVLGDKVMVTKNHYGLGVFNGDLGEVVAIKSGVLTVDFGDFTQDFSTEELDILTLAYACTVHKSQGSEFPLVIMPLVRHHYVMLQRNLLYTGMTRAKKQLVLIGDRWAIKKAINNNVQVKRFSKLGERIQANDLLQR